MALGSVNVPGDLSYKQDRLTGTPGQVVGFGADGSAMAVNRWSNTGLLINGDFRHPVNRNGKGEYTAGGYTIDKWYTWNIGKAGVLRIVDGGIKLEGEEHTSIVLDQVLDDRFDLYGKIVTISILVESVVGGFELQITDSFSKQFSENGLISITGIIKKVENYKPRFRVFNVQPNSSCIIKAAKLDLGSVQTLARQNEAGEWELIDPPNYALQYALCSQYSPITGKWVGSQHSNPNLLDNWYFVDPINQRGQKEYSGTGYTIDRWQIANAKLLLREVGIHLVSTDYNNTFVQLTENWNSLIGKSVTLSFLCKNVTGAWIVAAYNNVLSSFTTDGLVTITFVIPEGVLNVNQFIGLAGYAGSEIDLIAAKLELGPIQTLAHKEGDTWVLNDPPPNKALELAKCQRYQWIPKSSSFWLYMCPDTTQRLTLPLPVTMRATPTVSFECNPNGPVVNNEFNTRNSISFYTANTARASIYDLVVDANL